MLINGQEHEITFEEAVKWHREMWNWIAEQEENGSRRDRCILKKEWLREHGFELVCNNSFACEFALEQSLKEDGANKVICIFCPFIWNNNIKKNNKISKDECPCEFDGKEDIHWYLSDPRKIENLPLNPIYLCCALQGGNEDGK